MRKQLENQVQLEFPFMERIIKQEEAGKNRGNYVQWGFMYGGTIGLFVALIGNEYLATQHNIHPVIILPAVLIVGVGVTGLGSLIGKKIHEIKYRKYMS